MTTKLTLSVEKKVVRQAKRYAYKTGRSLSQLVEQYLDSLTNEDLKTTTELSPKLKRLYGAVKLPGNLNHKKEIRKILSSKD